MATTTNTFTHPTDNSSIEATIETSWTGGFIISEMQRNEFLKELENVEKEEYRLVIKRTSTEFGAQTTAAEAGVEDGDVINVVIRPKAGYDSWTGVGQRCARCGVGAYDPYREETETDEDGNKTVTEIYKCNHCGNLWHFVVYREEVED